MNSHGQNAFGILLTDHILIKMLLDFHWFQNGCQALGFLIGLTIFQDNLVTKFNTFIADINGRPCDQFPYSILALTAEGTADSHLIYPVGRHN